MSSPRTNGLYTPLALSVGAHVIVVFGLTVVGRFSFPAPPIPIEILPLHRSTEQVGEERRGVPNAREPPRAAEKAVPRPSVVKKGPGTGERHAPRPPRPSVPPPPQTADLSPYAPLGANLVVLLSTPALRSSVHRKGVEGLLSALPDYATLLDGTDLSPIDDLDALLIATPDPRDMTATFLAARHHGEARVSRLAERPLMQGDPRVFRVLSPELIVLTRPEAAARLDQAHAAPGAPDDPKSGWLALLKTFGESASRPGAPALLVTLSNAPSLLRFGAELPTPQSIALAATADPSPSLRAKLVFAMEEEARAFERAWPQILTRYRSATALFGLSSALDGLSLRRSATTLEWTGRLPEAQLRLALSLAEAFLPQRRAAAAAQTMPPAMPPPVPPMMLVDGGEPAR